MMRRRSPMILSIVLVAPIACRDPHVDIVVTLPDSLRAMAASVTLVTLIPPSGSAPFSCEDLAYQRVPADVLRLSDAGEIVLRGEGTAPVPNIDRLIPRMFRADVRDQNDAMIANACSMLGEFSSDVVVRLDAEPAAHIALTGTPDLSVTKGANAIPDVTLKVLDATGTAIPNAPLPWVIAGAAGATGSGMATTANDGTLALVPTYPSAPGPFVLDLRVRWAPSGPLLLSGFVAPMPKIAALRGLPLGAVVGRIGPTNGVAVAVLVSRLDGAFVDTYDASSFGGVQLAPIRSIPVPSGMTMSLLDFPGEPADRILLVSTASGSMSWMEIDPLDPKPPSQRTWARPRGAGAIRKVLRSGACGPSKPLDVLITFDGDVSAHYNAAGSLLATEPTSAIASAFASGCISDQSGAAYRTYVRTAAIGGLVLDVDTAPMMRASVNFLALQSGLAFSPPFGGTQLILGTQLVFNDVVVTRGRLHTGGMALDLDTVGSDHPPTKRLPYSTTGADIDGDHQLDVVAILADAQLMSYTLWAAIAGEYQGARIAGELTLPFAGLCLPLVIGGDFDGDGVDDLIVAEASRLLCGGGFDAPRVYFYSMK
jgi:hypothetical protein